MWIFPANFYAVILVNVIKKYGSFQVMSFQFKIALSILNLLFLEKNYFQDVYYIKKSILLKSSFNDTRFAVQTFVVLSKDFV